MTWNYRIIKHEENGETYYAIHEVYYDKNGKPEAVTKESIAAQDDTPEGIKQQLEWMLLALKEPTLNYEDF